DTAALLWEVTAHFDSQLDPRETDENQRPENRTPDWEWDYEEQDEHLEKDAVTGVPVINAVKEPLLLEGPVLIAVLRIERWELHYDESIALNYINHVNSAEFWGAPAKTVRCGIRARQQVADNNEKLWRVQY